MSWLNGKGVAPGIFKEGKGVSKEEPDKKGIFKFLDVVWAKLGKFIQVNSLYSGLSILWLIFLYCAPRLDFDWLLNISGNEQQAYILQSYLRILFALVVFNLIGNPLIAPSYAFVTRCFTRGEPVWIWSDGWDIFKQNIKQSLALFFIDAAIIFMGVFGAMFYYYQYASTGNYMWLFMCAVFATVIFVYTIMHFYIYQIMIAFDCTLMQLIKNAMLCAIAHLPMSILLTVISAGIVIMGLSLTGYPGMNLFLLFDLIVGLCITRFPMEFYASRVIGKKIRQQEKKLNRNKAKITYTGEGK